MTPIFLERDNLRLGNIMSLAVSSDGRRVYVGRALSDDQTRDNLAVLDRPPNRHAARQATVSRQ